MGGAVGRAVGERRLAAAWATCAAAGRGSDDGVYFRPPSRRVRGEKRGWSWDAADAVQEGRDEDSESVALSAPPDSPGLAC